MLFLPSKNNGNNYKDLYLSVVFILFCFGFSAVSFSNEENLSDLILNAALNNDTQVALSALKQQENNSAFDVNHRASDGTTALHWAVYNDNESLLKKLIKAGANVNARNDYGATPMSEAATLSNEKIINYLLKTGADVESPNLEGQTALMTVARSNNVKAAKLLIKNGANVNAREQWKQQSALMWASAQSQAAMVALLIKHGADVNARSHLVEWERRVSAEPRPQNRPLGGLTPLLFAAREGCVECARALVKGGADINLADPNGISPLLMASLNARFDLAAFLISAGADVNKWDIWGRSPLYSVVDYNTLPQGGRPDRPSLDDSSALQVIELLLKAGANPNVQLKLFPPYRSLGGDRGGDNFLGIGTTPLIRAAKAGDIDSIQLLLKYGALPDLKNWAGYTPLIAASGLGSTSVDARARFMNQEKNLMVAKVLLSAEINLNARTENGSSALHGAASRGWNKFVVFLLENGAEIHLKDHKGFTALDAAKGLIPSRRGFVSEAHPETVVILEEFIAQNN